MKVNKNMSIIFEISKFWNIVIILYNLASTPTASDIELYLSSLNSKNANK